MHNEEIHNFYASPNVIRFIKTRMIRWTEHVTHMGEMGIAYTLLVEKREGKRALGRLRRRWEDNIRMDLGEIWWGSCGLDSSGSG